MITVYTTKGCTRCEVLKRWLATTNITYNIVVPDDAKINSFITAGISMFPVIEEDGKYEDGIDYMRKHSNS